MKKEILNDMIAGGESLHTRKEFLQKAIYTGAVLTVPISILPGCGDDGGGSPHRKTGKAFEITFSKPMNKASVEVAVLVEPAVPCFFALSPVWSENDTVVVFECADSVAAGEYTLTIAGTARDMFGYYLDGNSDGTGGDEYEGALVF